MRVLFTFVGGQGHFDPLVAFARATEALGHDVAFGCDPSKTEMVAAAGFCVFPLGSGASQPPIRLPLRAVDTAREDREFVERFARRAARYRVPRIVALSDRWRPDLVVCDETDFGAMIAAEKLGLPFSTVLVIAAGSFVRAEVIADALGELREEHRLSPDPDLEMLSRYLVLSPFPRSFRDPAHPLPATAHPFRPLVREATGTPRWASVLRGAPTLYFTLGTVFNTESGDLLERVLSALSRLQVNLVVTVGHEIDPAEFGPQPDHVWIERHIAQSSVLPHCDLVVSHGGSGSVIGALSHGLPSVLIPLGADQPSNAERCLQLGVARVLDATRISADVVREAVSAMLGDGSHRRNAECIRDEIAALPEAGAAVSLFERLVAERRPIPSS